ncbi:MAG: hypothetical protein MJY97_11150 [Bacteroidales bacterium]|nr:hypothetical protein [Bacteroidales bacterium]
MRIFDEKHNNMLDSAHFRFIQLDGNFIRFFNETFKENVEWEKFSIEFLSEEDAELKFEELSKEVGWLSIKWNKKKTLLNTFCFCRFYLDSELNPEGIRFFKIVFWNNGRDKFIITYKDKASALEQLKALAI